MDKNALPTTEDYLNAKNAKLEFLDLIDKMERHAKLKHEVIKAFIAAQKEFKNPTKNCVNPFHKNKYADLGACIDAVKPALEKHDLGFTQTTHETESGVKVETVFMHTSGQTLSGGTLHLPVSKNDPQGHGSSLSYARRYSFCAATGITSEDDDDGNAGSGMHNKKQQQRQAPAAQPQTQQRKGPSDAQLKRLWAITKESGFTSEQVKQHIKNKYGIDSSKDLSYPQYDELCNYLESLKV